MNSLRHSILLEYMSSQFPKRIVYTLNGVQIHTILNEVIWII